MSLAFEASVGVKDEGDQLICPPAQDFESYTDIVERVTKILSKRPRTGTVVLRLTPRNVASGPPPAPRTPEALLNWEKALGLLQQTSQLIVAFVDGPIDDLTLSLALACDVRVGAPGASFAPALVGALVPTWWLASLAYHIGALRASQLLKRTTTSPAVAAGAEALVKCGLLLQVVPADDVPRFLATAVVPEQRDGAPRDKPLQLLRRILLQSFSLQNSDGIGHALAANSLLIAEALERLAASPAAPPPPMRPLGFSISEGGGGEGGGEGGEGGGGGGVWEVSLTSELHRVSIEELLSGIGGLSKRLEARVNEGKPLPSHLLLRLRVAPTDTSPPTTTTTAATTAAAAAAPPPADAPPPVPLQLLHEEQQPPTDARILRWLTRWEKVLAAVSTLPLPTVAHLVCDGGDGGGGGGGDGGGGATGVASLAALQLAFACDLRVASSRVRLGFCCSSGLLPGTLTFRLAKHVGAGRAMELLALPGSVSAAYACELGAVQLVAEDGEVPASFVASPAAHGPKLMLCRSLLDATWHSSAATIAGRIAQYEATAGRVAASSSASAASAAASVVATAAATVAAAATTTITTTPGEKDQARDQARDQSRDQRALEMSELLSSFLPDQFIMPTDSWVWRLNFAAPNTANAAAAAATGTGASTPDGTSPMRVRRSAGEDHIDPSAATATAAAAATIGLKVEEREGVLVATFAAARLASPTLVEFVAVMRALAAQLAHGARALLLVLPGGADALRMPGSAAPELRQLWASALEELEGLPFPSCALLGGGGGGGVVSEASLELALACRTRLALRSTAAASDQGDHGAASPPLSFGLGGWRAAGAPLPSARLWQLVRSAGVGTMAHHLLGNAAGGSDELLRWGVLDGLVASQEEAARSLLRAAAMVSATTFATDAPTDAAPRRTCPTPHVLLTTAHRCHRTGRNRQRWQPQRQRQRRPHSRGEGGADACARHRRRWRWWHRL